MTNRWRVGCLFAGMLAVGFAPAMAQAPMQAPRTYECAANAHCSVVCEIDGEKQMQTGAPKTVTITTISWSLSSRTATFKRFIWPAGKSCAISMD